MGWNGLDLQTDFADMLGNNRASFLLKVSRWIREIEEDICQNHKWPFLRKKGKKILSQDAVNEEQSLLSPVPENAPTVAKSNGGTLTLGSTYYVKVSFYESIADVETEPSEASNSIEIQEADTDRTINLTNIPVSEESLVTARRIYLKKDNDVYYLYGTINNNVDTTYSITSDTTSKIEPIDFEYFDTLDNKPFFESSAQLTEMSIHSIRDYYPGNINQTSGVSYVYAMLDQYRLLMYPAPTQDLELSFYYFKMPRGIYPSVDSTPTIPKWLKTTLELGVRWKGYEYYDRDNTVEAFNKYNAHLRNMIGKKGKSNYKSGRIRDVTGNSDGFAV